VGSIEVGSAMARASISSIVIPEHHQIYQKKTYTCTKETRKRDLHMQKRLEVGSAMARASISSIVIPEHHQIYQKKTYICTKETCKRDLHMCKRDLRIM